MKGQAVLLSLVALGIVLQVRTTLMVQDYYKRCERREISFTQALVVDSPYRNTAPETVLGIFWKSPWECGG